MNKIGVLAAHVLASAAIGVGITFLTDFSNCLKTHQNDMTLTVLQGCLFAALSGVPTACIAYFTGLIQRNPFAEANVKE
jgi:hypothetical protein